MERPFQKMGIWALLPKSQHALFDQKTGAWRSSGCAPESPREPALLLRETWLTEGSVETIPLLQRNWSLGASHPWAQEENLAALLCSRLPGLEVGAGTLLLGAAWVPPSGTDHPGWLATHLVLGEEGPIVWAHNGDMVLRECCDGQSHLVLALEQTLARVFTQAKGSQSKMFNRWRTSRDAWKMDEAWGPSPSVYGSKPGPPRL